MRRNKQQVRRPLAARSAERGSKDVALRVDGQIMNLGQGSLIDNERLPLGRQAINEAVRHAARQKIPFKVKP